jgi:hypothetical protein
MPSGCVCRTTERDMMRRQDHGCSWGRAARSIGVAEPNVFLGRVRHWCRSCLPSPPPMPPTVRVDGVPHGCPVDTLELTLSAGATVRSKFEQFLVCWVSDRRSQNSTLVVLRSHRFVRGRSEDVVLNRRTSRLQLLISKSMETVVLPMTLKEIAMRSGDPSTTRSPIPW